MAAYRSFSATIVLPIAVTTPVIFVLFLGSFAYRERLGRMQLAGSLAGAASVLLLALGRS